jgi:hypothetical protein
MEDVYISEVVQRNPLKTLNRLVELDEVLYGVMTLKMTSNPYYSMP